MPEAVIFLRNFSKFPSFKAFTSSSTLLFSSKMEGLEDPWNSHLQSFLPRSAFQSPVPPSPGKVPLSRRTENHHLFHLIWEPKNNLRQICMALSSLHNDQAVILRFKVKVDLFYLRNPRFCKVNGDQTAHGAVSDLKVGYLIPVNILRIFSDIGISYAVHAALVEKCIQHGT